MVPWEFAATAGLVIYIAVCFGKIAARHGKNPILYGFLSIIPPINLIVRGIWAFSNPDKSR